jgi:hypothetical protein
MFKKMLGKKKDSSIDTSEIKTKISKMNLTDMRAYLKNHIEGFKTSEDGIIILMERLNSLDSSGKRFVEFDAMDSKKKKLFELIILLATDKKVSVKSVELLQQFIEIYDDIISDYDKRNKQIYTSRLNDALSSSVNMVNHLSELKRKTNILGN